MLRDTCKRFEKPAPACLDVATAASCGYNLHTTSTTACAACPPGAFCPGGARVWPQPGFWVSGEVPGVADPPVACQAPATARCLGWDPEARATQCGEGYAQGVYKCGACAHGYFSTIANRTCRRCPESGDAADAEGSCGQGSSGNKFLYLYASVLSVARRNTDR